MSDSGYLREESQGPVAAGEWWVLLVTEGLTVEFPPELYRDRTRAEREGDRWAHLLSVRSGDPIERPFEGRWEIGDHWIRLVPSFLPEEGSEIWVGTYWGRDGSPEPEAALFAGVADARAWVQDPAPGRLAYETHEVPWSVAVTYKVRGGEEEAEAHLGKVVASLVSPLAPLKPTVLWGFEVSEGLIPRGPELFERQDARDRALRQLLDSEMANRNWQDLVSGTAEGNYVENELPRSWRENWSESRAIDWLSAFSFIGDGDDFEVRSFETTITPE